MIVTEKYIKPANMAEFRELLIKHGQLEGLIQLAGGACRSSKTVWHEETPTGQFRYVVFNDIDGTIQSLSENRLAKESNIVDAVEKGCWWFHNPDN